jgi:2-polyprenyl-3-methyl-5-hydroxy-6-metoxy-1,4-benzoquinol methylase
MEPKLGDYRYRGLKELYRKVLGYPSLMRRSEARFIFPFLKESKRLQILDAGCGDGLMTIELAKRGYEVYAIDINRKILRKLIFHLRASPTYVRKRIHIILGDITLLPFKEIYDMVLSNCVLEHVKEDSKALYEFQRCLRPRGKLILTVDSEWRMRSNLHILARVIFKMPRYLRKLIGTKYIADGECLEEALEKFNLESEVIRGYTKERIERIVAKNGLSVKKVRYYMKLFSAIYTDARFTIKLFADRELVRALCFPIIYPLTLLERYVPDELMIGVGIAVLAEKPVKDVQKQQNYGRPENNPHQFRSLQVRQCLVKEEVNLHFQKHDCGPIWIRYKKLNSFYRLISFWLLK